MFQEVKLVGMGQPWSGVAPSGPAFMYQAQATPPPATLTPTPDATQPPSWDLEQNPPPQPAVPAVPVLPPSPAAAAPASRKINTKYVVGGIALLAFAAALLIPSNR
jgi:hypothetical protein